MNTEEKLENNDSFVLLSLGANIGSKVETIKSAIETIEEVGILSIIKKSSLFATEPYGVKNQDWFVNISIYGTTALSAKNLLLKCKEIENKFGRKKRQKWHERELDIDIILYDNLKINTIELTIPHAEYKKRNFVLVPSAEIVGELIPCDSKLSISQLSEKCEDNSKIKRLD